MSDVTNNAHKKQVQQGAARRLKVLEAVTEFINEHGYSPSGTEIAEATGFSEKTVHRHIAALIEEGRLRRGGRGHRAIGLVD